MRVTILDLAVPVHMMLSCEIPMVNCQGLPKEHSCMLADFLKKQCSLLYSVKILVNFTFIRWTAVLADGFHATCLLPYAKVPYDQMLASHLLCPNQFFAAPTTP